MLQKILLGTNARAALLSGINQTNDVVKVTLGPQGKNVVSNHVHGALWSSKDGIRVIREIALENQFENAGVKLVRQASQKTAGEAGDATTTTCIIASALVNQAHELIQSGISAIKLRKEIERSSRKAIEWVNQHAIKMDGDIEKIRHIATISANNNQEIGDLIANAFKEIGTDGQIDLRESLDNKTEIEVMGGFYFNKGMMHPYFITNPAKAECELESVLVMIYDKILSKVNDVMPALKYAVEQDMAILILCSNIEGEALSTIVQNKQEGKLKVCVVQCPEQGARRMELMEDIAIFTGGEIISEDLGKPMDQFNSSWLGTASKSIIGRAKTIIVNGQGDTVKIQNRKAQIKESITEAKSDLEKEYLRNRAASIGKGVAVLHIAAPTEIEKGDKMDLAEDSILAVRSAIEEGYLPGGGISYLRCASMIGPDENNLFVHALQAPFKQLISNSDQDYEESLAQAQLFENVGYNAKTDVFEDLVKAGVIDAAKVIRAAIENAASVAMMFCATEVLIVETESK